MPSPAPHPGRPARPGAEGERDGCPGDEQGTRDGVEVEGVGHQEPGQREGPGGLGPGFGVHCVCEGSHLAFDG